MERQAQIANAGAPAILNKAVKNPPEAAAAELTALIIPATALTAMCLPQNFAKDRLYLFKA